MVGVIIFAIVWIISGIAQCLLMLRVSSKNWDISKICTFLLFSFFGVALGPIGFIILGACGLYSSEESLFAEKNAYETFS